MRSERRKVFGPIGFVQRRVFGKKKRRRTLLQKFGNEPFTPESN